MISFEFDKNDREWDIKARTKHGLQFATIKLKSNVVARTPVDTGNLKGSISRKVISKNITSTGIVGTNVEYARYVNSGTGPHKTSSGSANFKENIKEWCKRHGIDNPWGVIKSIRKKGTKPTNFFELTTQDERQTLAAFQKGFNKK